MLYSLNREVGELRSTRNNEQKEENELKTQIDKAEERITNRIDNLSSDVDRLEQRIDNIIDNKLRHTNE